MQIQLPDMFSKFQHDVVAEGEGQNAEHHPPEQVRSENRLEPVEHCIEPLSRSEIAPIQVMPVDVGKIQMQPPPQEDVPEISTERGDGDRGPRIIDEGGSKNEGPVQFLEDHA